MTCLGKTLNLSIPKYIYLQKSSYFLGLLWRLNELICVKHLGQCPSMSCVPTLLAREVCCQSAPVEHLWLLRQSLSSFTHLQVSAQLPNDQGRALASSWEKKGQKRCCFLLLFSHSVLSRVRLFMTPGTAAGQVSMSFYVAIVPKQKEKTFMYPIQSWKQEEMEGNG